MKRIKKDLYSLESLPTEVLSHVLLFIQINEMLSFRLVGSMFNESVLNPYSWTERTLTVFKKANEMTEDFSYFLKRTMPTKVSLKIPQSKAKSLHSSSDLISNILPQRRVWDFGWIFQFSKFERLRSLEIGSLLRDGNKILEFLSNNPYLRSLQFEFQSDIDFMFKKPTIGRKRKFKIRLSDLEIHWFVTTPLIFTEPKKNSLVMIDFLDELLDLIKESIEKFMIKILNEKKCYNSLLSYKDFGIEKIFSILRNKGRKIKNISIEALQTIPLKAQKTKNLVYLGRTHGCIKDHCYDNLRVLNLRGFFLDINSFANNFPNSLEELEVQEFWRKDNISNNTSMISLKKLCCGTFFLKFLKYFSMEKMKDLRIRRNSIGHCISKKEVNLGKKKILYSKIEKLEIMEDVAASIFSEKDEYPLCKSLKYLKIKNAKNDVFSLKNYHCLEELLLYFSYCGNSMDFSEVGLNETKRLKVLIVKGFCMNEIKENKKSERLENLEVLRFNNYEPRNILNIFSFFTITKIKLMRFFCDITLKFVKYLIFLIDKSKLRKNSIIEVKQKLEKDYYEYRKKAMFGMEIMVRHTKLWLRLRKVPEFLSIINFLLSLKTSQINLKKVVIWDFIDQVNDYGAKEIIETIQKKKIGSIETKYTSDVIKRRTFCLI